MTEQEPYAAGGYIPSSALPLIEHPAPYVLTRDARNALNEYAEQQAREAADCDCGKRLTGTLAWTSHRRANPDHKYAGTSATVPPDEHARRLGLQCRYARVGDSADYQCLLKAGHDGPHVNGAWKWDHAAHDERHELIPF